MSEPKIVGYFMETGIWHQGKELPPQKTPITMIGSMAAFDLDKCKEDDDVEVMSLDGNWYTIKKKDILFE